jgi:hypothetical protein
MDICREKEALVIFSRGLTGPIDAEKPLLTLKIIRYRLRDLFPARVPKYRQISLMTNLFLSVSGYHRKNASLLLSLSNAALETMLLVCIVQKC